MSYGHHVFDDLRLIIHEEEKIMKKQIVTILTALSLGIGATIYVAIPEQPVRYQLHIVSYGETLEGIVRNANQETDVDYSIRDAISISVEKSKGLDGGATSRNIKVGDKVAVPVYR